MKVLLIPFEILKQAILHPAGLFIALALLGATLFFSKRNSSGAKATVIFINLLISARYILWRSIFTINRADYIALFISIALLVAEIYGFLMSILFYYQSYDESHPVSPEGGDGSRPSVDIFIPIYNEPKEILLRTIIGCKAQDYPPDRFEVYVLDDGGREEIMGMALRLGCKYIARPTREHAKAGNLNNALEHSDGELVAIFDCDHVPVRSFLKETVGYFKDSLVAIVQTPHHFYNTDPFQRNLRLESELANEQDLFFRVIQPGRDRYNAAFFAGSCGVLRRSALAGIGDFLTSTITEDLHTSLELHARGLKSVYVNKNLSAGLAPESTQGYLTQRQRWAEGAMQCLRIDSPLFKKGLTIPQRIQYTASIIYFFTGIARIIYLVTPLSYLFFNYPPIMTGWRTMAAYFLPHYLATTMAFNMISRGNRDPFWGDVYESFISFALASAVIKTFLKPYGRSFRVTPKGIKHSRVIFRAEAVLPHMILGCLLLIGAQVGIYALLKGSLPAIISVVWALYNMIILFTAVLSARERPQRRGNIRLPRSIRCVLRASDEDIACVTTDVSETGVGINLDRPVDFDPPVVSLDLISDYGEVTRLRGRIVTNDMEKGRYNLGISFIDMTPELSEGIIRQIFCPEKSWSGRERRIASLGFGHFLRQLSMAVKAQFTGETELKRAAPRFYVERACEVLTPEGYLHGTTRDISTTGISISITEAKVSNPITVVVPIGDGSSIEAKGEVLRRVERGRRILLGIRFLDHAEGRQMCETLVPAKDRIFVAHAG